MGGLWPLPTSWKWASFADVADIASNLQSPDRTPELPHVAPNHMESGTGRLLEYRTVGEDGVTSPKHKFRPGQILYSKIRPYLAKAVLVDFEGLCSADVYPVDPKIDAAFLHQWLVSPAFTEAASRSQGRTVLPKINQDALAKLPAPLPPLNEQRRIVARLEELQGRVRAARAALDALPPLLDRFRQSVLAAAFRGDLTADWRAQNPDVIDSSILALQVTKAHLDSGGHAKGNAADPSEGVHDLSPAMFPSPWRLLTLRDLVEPQRPITYGILKPGPEVQDGVPYIRVADFPNEVLRETSLRRTSIEVDCSYRRSRLRSGDLLLSIRGTVGRIVSIPRNLEGANITQDSARLSVQGAVHSDYVLWYLRSPSAQARMARATKGVAVRGINIGDVRALQVPLPSKPEQHEIVRRISGAMALVGKVRRASELSLQRLDRLQQSLLARAFRGELVPQDPDDEPASVLLERLRAEREAAASAGPRRRRHKP